VARSTADDGAAQLRAETRELSRRLADLEAEVYNRPAGSRPAVHAVSAASRRSHGVVGTVSNSVTEAAPSAPARLVEAAAVLLEGISLGVIRQVEFGFDVFGSFTDAILGRTPIDRSTSRRSRRSETSGRLGRGRWAE
jgi:hypothetical protein